jgi:hypothetical protein
MAINLYPKNAKDRFELAFGYRWEEWDSLQAHLNFWGIDTREFAECRNGHEISSEKCELVADALAKHYEELPLAERDWFAGHAKRWRAFVKTDGCIQM